MFIFAVLDKINKLTRWYFYGNLFGEKRGYQEKLACS